MVLLEKTMFRAYDIRGMVNEKELNEKSVGFIGKGFGTMLKRKGIKKCVVGFDARSYSKSLSEAIIQGLLDTGVNVINIGMVTTPVSYFSQYLLKSKGLAMITASHNPNGWSGLKLGCDFSSTLVTKEIEELYNLIAKEDFEKGKGKQSKKKVIPAYIKNLLKRVKLKKKFKIVVNARNGIAGAVAPILLKAAGMKVIEQFCKIDFSYPNGDANPSLESMLKELGEKVVKEKADLGFAFDADGDRLGLVDEKGIVIYPDRILLLLSRLVLGKEPGSAIIFDVKSTQALNDDILAHGGKPVMWLTGHSFIKEKLHELKAPLAGERSGHIFFNQGYFGFDDASFASLKLLEYLSMEKKSLSEISKTIPKYYSSSVIHAACPDEIKYNVLEKVVAFFKQKYPKVITVDGIRVVFEDGWGLARVSSNLPVFVFTFEAKTPERLKEIEALFRQELSQFPEISKDWHNG